jgi:hypothetical protein
MKQLTAPVLVCLFVGETTAFTGLGSNKTAVVKSAGAEDLVFQSVKEGKPHSDQDILKRHV